MTSMPAPKLCCRNTSHPSPTAMEQRARRSRAMRDRSVIKVRFKGPVSLIEKRVEREITQLTNFDSKWPDSSGK